MLVAYSDMTSEQQDRQEVIWILASMGEDGENPPIMMPEDRHLTALFEILRNDHDPIEGDGTEEAACAA